MANLTDRVARQAENTGRDHVIWDSTLKGFGLRVTARGTKRWLVGYRAGGKARRQTLGDPAVVACKDARAKARELLSRAALGEDPWAEREARSEVPTFADAARDWQEDRIAKRKWGNHTRTTVDRLVRNVLIPAFGDRRVDEITRKDIKKFHRARASTPQMANRAVDWCDAFYAWLLDEEVVEATPTARIERYPEPPRKRVATEDELRALWTATRSEPAPWGSFFRLLILLGTRQSELWGARWKDIDGNRLFLPETKNGEPRYVTLGGPALAEIERLRERYSPDTHEFVFGKRLTVGQQKTAWARLKKAAGLEDAGLTLHDLRRTKGSYAYGKDVPLGVVSRMLGHANEGTTARVYAHMPEDAVTQAEARIQDALAAQLDGEPAEVVPLRR